MELNRDTTDADAQLDELLATNHREHRHYLAVDLTDREIGFLGDLDAIRLGGARPLRLTDKQSLWLSTIHSKACRHAAEADALARTHARVASGEFRVPRIRAHGWYQD